MRTILLLAVVLVGCGSNGPHDLVECDDRWQGFATGKTCERACIDYEQTAGPNRSCTVAVEDLPSDRLDRSFTPCRVYEYDGLVGCCIATMDAYGNGETGVVFAECNSEPMPE